jgi:hypothetical protein
MKCWVKTHHKGAKVVVTLYIFSGAPCLNFNHVIIMKNLNNFLLRIMMGENPKKSNAKKIILIYLIRYDVRIYL